MAPRTSPSARLRRRAVDLQRHVVPYETDLERVSDAYAAMDERRAIKSLIRVATP
jgi:hypothetical protein